MTAHRSLACGEQNAQQDSVTAEVYERSTLDSARAKLDYPCPVSHPICILGAYYYLQQMKPKIILLDLETAPTLAYVWQLYEADAISVKKDWFILSFSTKELGSKKSMTRCLVDYPATYKKDAQDDSALVDSLWRVMDEADVIIAHNGDKFDIRKANARFIYHDLKPPSPYRTVDTLKIARKHFKFDSNRLNDLAEYLKIGRKLPHQGFKNTWLGAMSGIASAWNVMRRYNKHDIDLLEKVYLRIRGWATTHVNLENYTKDGNCPNCQTAGLQHRGFIYSKPGKKQRLFCRACGAWSSGSKLIK